jgi:hypothetical protein
VKADRAVDFDRLAHWRILPVLTEDEVRALVPLSPSSLHRLRRAGRLEVVPDCGRVLYRTASVMRLVGEEPTPDAVPPARADRAVVRDAVALMRRIPR